VTEASPEPQMADAAIAALALDGAGGALAAGLDEEPDGVLWLHLDRMADDVQRWLAEESGLHPVIREALLVEETRPRIARFGNGLIVILRGVNLNPGADPEDMVSIRIWIEPGRVISTRRFRLMAVEDVRGALAEGRGPRTAGELVVALADRLTERMAPVIWALDETVDEIEEALLDGSAGRELRGRLVGVRRQAIALRRYLAPQREALNRLAVEPTELFGDLDRVRLREEADRVTRYVEDLDAGRERAMVVQDELATRLSEAINRNMYLLSVVAAVFLPLGLLTGLLGINVGGIPGSEVSWAFAAVCALVVLLALVELILLRRLRWL